MPLNKNNWTKAFRNTACMGGARVVTVIIEGNELDCTNSISE